MLQQIARQQDIVEIAPQGSTLKAAALAHVAEQYGYTYGMAYRTGFKNSLVQVRMYRDPQPDARVREAATIAAHPQAGNGGTVPGLEQGSLKPLPEAVGAVAVLKDLVTFDVMAQYVADRRQKVLVYLACAVLTALLLIDSSPVEAVASGGAAALLFTVAFKVGEIRRGQIAQRLTDAGFLAVRDEQGGQRFLRPGQQLPGHTDPFAA
ncbi:hypothetical protein AR457_34835 [Streptomyces agglomeratus]|uniref:Uncharacterized protein n=2 Tax=Streptomyces agglomeratus TaxID=285458 RepID=A0A1E5PGV3_9ACTN|nr:hypothetical protein AS594_34175 [Streptomyces agglomeratus]OEJ37176.1 hypothetical protein BGK70_02330 [Streptomyces agglomeratus]OEJ48529.1 hypothetical protein AR457_34835 [Streptomyces agglomeratus]OEJ57031.1 hypothetical protein BGM19_02400 [Streptomyces agglomeratus]